MVVAGFVAVPLAVAAVTILAGHDKLRANLAASRGVLVVLGAVVGLLLVLPIGSEQIDDVVRAWTIVSAPAAVLAAVLAAGVVLGAVRQLTAGTPEHLQPYDGDRPTTVLGWLVGALALAFFVAGITGLGWGLIPARSCCCWRSGC